MVYNLSIVCDVLTLVCVHDVTVVWGSYVCVNNITAVCGGMLTATDRVGELYSHAKYGDQNYENKEDCIWRIVAENELQRIRLRFQTFEVEEEPDCG